MVYTRPETVTPSTAVENYAAYTVNNQETGYYCYAKTYQAFTTWPAWLATSAEGATLTYENVVMLPKLMTDPESFGGYPGTISSFFQYGYVCNASNTANVKKSSFDIGWAVDKEGNKVNLPGIDFVKVQTSTLQDLGSSFGPACTSINCGIDLHLADIKVTTSEAEAAE